jgi:pectate lyase
MLHAQLLAFPGAEGAGAFAVGGRSSNNIYVVTNLNDSGVGSLRHAVDTAPGSGRMIVFGIGGTINLASDINVDSPNITIAGQSASGVGITLAHRPLVIKNTHDVIVQHIAVRPGDYSTGGPDGPPTGLEPDSIWVSNSRNVIVDHVSASWSTDELLSVTNGSTNVTVQWSLITEALHNSNHSKENHGYGGIIQGGEVTVHHNLYANNRSRNPATGSNYNETNVPSDPANYAHIDFVNNVISNPGDRYSYGSGGVYEVNWAHNYGIEGPDTTRENQLYFPNGTGIKVYYQGNHYDTIADGILQVNPASPSTLSPPVTVSPTPINSTNPPATTSAPLAYAQILSYAGASAARDPIDKRVINDVINQSGNHIDSQEQVGGYYYPTPISQQLDPDGLPDWWKSANGFNPNDNAVGFMFAPDGYTYLEKFLHERNAAYRPPAETDAIRVSTAFGNGADAVVSEVAGAASGVGDGAALGVQWTSGQRDDLAMLRFDLSRVQPGTVTNAAIELTAFQNQGSGTIRIYGLKHELGEQNWDETGINMSSAPGVNFDSNSATRNIAPSELLILGEVATGSLLEGQTLTLSNPDLTAFLNLLSYRANDTKELTIYLERRNSSGIATAFASKEANSLASNGTAEAGTYAPALLLDAVAAAPDGIPGDFNDNGMVDAGDYTVWRNNLGSWKPLENETESLGVVDEADYLVWRTHFGESFSVGSGAASASIPEPSSTVVLLLSVVIVQCGRRPGRWQWHE